MLYDSNMHKAFQFMLDTLIAKRSWRHSNQIVRALPRMIHFIAILFKRVNFLSEFGQSHFKYLQTLGENLHSISLCSGAAGTLCALYLVHRTIPSLPHAEWTMEVWPARQQVAQLGRPAHRSAQICRGCGPIGDLQRIICDVLPPFLQANNLLPKLSDPALAEQPSSHHSVLVADWDPIRNGDGAGCC